MEEITVRNVTFDSNKPKVCVSITGESFDEVIAQASQAKSLADVIEWRADFFEDILNEEQLMITLLALRDEIREIPLLFTYRTIEEGGQGDILIREYRSLYEFVVSSRVVDIVDIELFRAESLGSSFIKWIQSLDCKVLLSNHVFEETPDNSILLFRLNMMEHWGADIGKLAVMPKNRNDVLRLMEFTLYAQSFISLPLITMSMGELGKVSRLSGPLTGSIMTFGALGKESAPGQLPAEHLRQIIDLL